MWRFSESYGCEASSWIRSCFCEFCHSSVLDHLVLERSFTFSPTLFKCQCAPGMRGSNPSPLDRVFCLGDREVKDTISQWTQHLHVNTHEKAALGVRSLYFVPFTAFHVVITRQKRATDLKNKKKQRDLEEKQRKDMADRARAVRYEQFWFFSSAY